MGTVHPILQMNKLRLRDIKCLDQSHPVGKFWSQDRTPGCLLERPPLPPSHILLPLVALSPRGRWTGLPLDQVGGGDGLALLHRHNRTVLVGLVFTQQTFIAHLGVCMALCSTPKTQR